MRSRPASSRRGRARAAGPPARRFAAAKPVFAPHDGIAAVVGADAARRGRRADRRRRGGGGSGAMKTILHIGMPKTGSTVLQDCLRASRDRLAAQGVLYPANPPGCAFNNHRMLIFGFTAVPRPAAARAQVPRATRRANLGARLRRRSSTISAREVAAARPAALVLSSETPVPPARRRGAGRSLAAALARLRREPTVAVYLRRPSDYYLSALQQRLKSAHTVTPPRVQSPVGVLASYAAAFGAGGAAAAGLRPRRCSTSGDIVADFLAAYLPECGDRPGAR